MPISATNERHTAVRGLGEIALRVNDLDAMQRFYAEVIGLPLMTRVQNCAFFRIAVMALGICFQKVATNS